METQYKCIRTFAIDEVDGDGFRTGDFRFVEEGSIWLEDTEAVNITGGEVRLDRIDFEDDTIPWIEVSREDLTRDFEEF